MAPSFLALLNNIPTERSIVEAGLFGLAYVAVAALCAYLGRQMRETEALAEQRGVDLLNLEQVNDLIIRRMKTGVLLVDDANHILRINESAWHLIGNPRRTSAISARWLPNCRGACTTGAIPGALTRILWRWPRMFPK